MTLKVPAQDLGFHLDDRTYVVEAGEIQVFVGGDSLADRIGSVEIMDNLRIPPSERRAAVSRGLPGG